MWVILISLVYCLAIVLAGSGKSFAQQPLDIKITTIQLRHQQQGVGIERLAKYAQEKLKDKVRIRTYPAAQLYTGQEETQAVIKGEVQMAYVIASSMDLLDPSMELLKLPYLFPDIEIGFAVLEGSTGKKLFSKVEGKGILILGTTSSGTIVVADNKRPLKSVEDFKGLKMRGAGLMQAKTLKALGAISVVTASEETYTALQQGVIDGMIAPANVFLARKYYDVQKYVTNPGMMNAAFNLIIANNSWWNNLPSDVRGGLSNAIQRLVREQRAEMEVEDKKNFDVIAAKGCQVYYLTPEERMSWRKTLQIVYQESTPSIGVDLVKEAKQEVERLSKTKK
jgi:C4-dicarboxylate-binding protein DctP